MDKAVEDALYERLIARTERLLKVARMGRPPRAILGLMAEHVLFTLLPLCGEELFSAFWRRAIKTAQREHAICDFCGERFADSAIPRLCQTCVVEMEAEDQEIDLLTESPKGEA